VIPCPPANADRIRPLGEASNWYVGKEMRAAQVHTSVNDSLRSTVDAADRVYGKELTNSSVDSTAPEQWITVASHLQGESDNKRCETIDKLVLERELDSARRQCKPVSAAFVPMRQQHQSN